MKTYFIPLLILSFLLVDSCKNNPSNSSDKNDGGEVIPACNAIVTVSHRVGYAGYIYFTFHIENIGEKAIKKVTARYKFTGTDYSVSSGEIHAQGFELPPGSSHSYEHQRLGNLGYPIKPGATIEVTNISYICVY